MSCSKGFVRIFHILCVAIFSCISLLSFASSIPHYGECGFCYMNVPADTAVTFASCRPRKWYHRQCMDKWDAKQIELNLANRQNLCLVCSLPHEREDLCDKDGKEVSIIPGIKRAYSAVKKTDFTFSYRGLATFGKEVRFNPLNSNLHVLVAVTAVMEAYFHMLPQYSLDSENIFSQIFIKAHMWCVLTIYIYAPAGVLYFALSPAILHAAKSLNAAKELVKISGNRLFGQKPYFDPDLPEWVQIENEGYVSALEEDESDL